MTFSEETFWKIPWSVPALDPVKVELASGRLTVSCGCDGSLDAGAQLSGRRFVEI